jgi:hypothetical protein
MSKYGTEFLNHLASLMRAHRRPDGRLDRRAVIALMHRAYPETPLSPGALAAIYRDHAGGGVKAFLERFRVTDALEGRIIAQAMLDWEPEGAPFASAYALAAKRLNEQLAAGVNADEVEGMVRRMGGLFELLCDCGADAPTAKAAAARAAILRKRR